MILAVAMAPACVIERSLLYANQYSNGALCQATVAESRGRVSNLVTQEFTPVGFRYMRSTQSIGPERRVNDVTAYYLSGGVRETGRLVPRTGGAVRELRTYDEMGNLEFTAVSTNDRVTVYTPSERLKIWRHPTGVKTLFFRNGKIRELITVENGRVEGPWTSYWENGELQSHLVFDDHRIVGEARYYYFNGLLKSSQNFDPNGFPHGLAEQYDPSGVLKERASYSNADLKWKVTFFEGDYTNAYQEYDHGRLTACFRFKYPNLHKYVGVFSNGRLIGETLER